MLRKLVVVLATTFLLGACASEPPPPPPPPPPVQATAPSFNVFFDWDSTKLSVPALNVIEQAVDSFKKTGNARITATGHTDTSGSPEYNMGLSVRRANAVKAELVRQGVPAAAIATGGVGEAGLLVPTGDGVREPQNRRVEIMVSGQMVEAPATTPLGYCRALSASYRRNVSNSNADSVAGAALARCESGHTDEGIPTLERLLTSAKVPLPPRQY